MSNLNKPAMPHYDTDKEKTRPGLTIRQHAAITLRVPMSGDPELDAMIREARRLDMATEAMQGLMGRSWDAKNMTGEELFARWAESAGMCADALLAASEPKKADPCEVLRKVGDGTLRHLYRGFCPDSVEGPNVRDPDCPACQAIGDPEPDAEVVKDGQA